MTEKLKPGEIRMIPIDRIDVLNPRERNRVVFEEIVGNISDEYDNDLPDIVQLEDGWVRVSTRLSLVDLGEHFELELEDEDVDSVGGLLAKELGRLPARNDQIEFSGLIIRVDRVEGRRKRVVTALVKMSEDLIAARAALEVDEE